MLLVTALIACDAEDTALNRTSSEAPAVQPSVSAEVFVQQFLEWYRDQNGWREVLEERPDVLASDLRDLLANEAKQQDDSGGDIGALDFDPFLASQDPCDVYNAGNESISGTTARIRVVGDCTSAELQPDAVYELQQTEERWTITNIVYPRLNTDLNNVLGRLTPSNGLSR